MGDQLDYAYQDLGHLQGGELVEVTVSAQANALLMDGSNYNNFKSGRPHRYFGGRVTRSPTTIPVPNSGRWYIVVHLGGHRGQIRWGARILPGMMPTLDERPISSVPSLLRSPDNEPPARDVEEDIVVRDVFISHASEDKEDIAEPLASELRALGLSVWYDDYELKIGDSLRRKIDSGITHSRLAL